MFLIGTDDILRSSFRECDPKVGKAGALEERYRALAGDGLFRFSVGLEDPEDLMEDLHKVLRAV